MSFSRVKPLGWALFEELTSAEMNQLDVNVASAVDGANGGIYNLGAELQLLGSQVTIGILNTTWGAGEWPKVTSRPVQKACPMPHYIHAAWVLANEWCNYEQSDVTSNYKMNLDLTDQIPAGCTVTAMTAFVTGGSHVSLPATLPKIKAWLYNTTTPGYTSLGSTTDPSLTVGAYDAPHSISHNFSPPLVYTAGRLICSFYGEAGAGSIANQLNFHGVQLTYVVDRVRY